MKVDRVLVLPLETTALILKLRCKVGHLPTSPQTAASAETHVGPELKSTGMVALRMGETALETSYLMI
ncbi:hypothetical protein J1605_022935 [Eschrichtius robustus]|uniref:Uncharacterized protein n=1 Tax=Eschrichtius robustus TaxID=9764 RepID=A0AB34HA41_ESCRO|nr:hypothetical protein J1605_022935 [Eschrichtius robustus]